MHTCATVWDGFYAHILSKVCLANFANVNNRIFSLNFFVADIDNCQSSPCFNGACVDGVNSYTCQCHSGFSGARCEQGEKYCVLELLGMTDVLHSSQMMLSLSASAVVDATM